MFCFKRLIAEIVKFEANFCESSVVNVVLIEDNVIWKALTLNLFFIIKMYDSMENIYLLKFGRFLPTLSTYINFGVK